MTAREVANIIEAFAPIETQEIWDNSGFCIGSPSTEVKGLFLGFDCTPDLLREAIAAGANMVVTHHPLIFNGVKKIDQDTFLGEAICLAIKNDLVVYAAHTNADKAFGGVNSLMTERLQLSDVKPIDDSLLCLVGNLPKPMTSEQFSDYVKERFGIAQVRTSRAIEKPILHVAVSSGSGASFIETARFSGVDAIVTGDVSYHRFFCEDDFFVVDMGHYESEIDIVSVLFEILRKNYPNFAVSMTTNNNNPIYYR